MQLVLKSGRILFFFFIFFLSTISCDKVQDSQVPDVPFSFTINLTIANELTIPGNSMFFPGAGYGGVIVFCEMPDTYYAFDATCTHEISQTCKVVNSGVLGECSCCKSKFLFTGGAYPAKGPAAAPLRQYSVSRMSSVMLRVYN
jgi:nitrite reductase/ring-hydroxylating ferredoxin subunit